jgi:ribosome-associated toxin RatA of RatAB toxin-antitoxin module
MIRTVANIPAPPRHVFSILTDVDAYQDWMPGCIHSRTLESDDSMIDGEIILKSLRKLRFNLRFKIQNQHTLTFQLLKGSDFKRYEGSWQTLWSSDQTGTVVIGQIEFDAGYVAPAFIASSLVRTSMNDTVRALSQRALEVPRSETSAEQERILDDSEPKERILHIMKLEKGYRIWCLGQTQFIKSDKPPEELSLLNLSV